VVTASPIEDPNEELDFDKCVGQFRLALNGVLQPLRLYGQQNYVDSALLEIVSLAIQLHLKLSGLDFPYHVNEDKLHW